MPSPFPGMDPYLEDGRLWPEFQHQLVACLYQLLLPNVADRYRARVSQRRYQTETPLFTSVIREEHCEEFIEIRYRGDSRLVTLLDIVSPMNKTSAASRSAYLQTRQTGKQSGASLVEIDLVMEGAPTLEFSRDGLPEWDYAVTVTRSTQPERFEIYTATLAKRLPKFRMPLAADDRDTVLDLQASLTRCYDQNGYGRRIDYSKDPLVRLDDADRQWTAELLRQQKLRQ